MGSIEARHRRILTEEQRKQKRKRDRTRYWTQRFANSVSTSCTNDGLTQTQIPTMRRLIAPIVSQTDKPGEVLHPIMKNKIRDGRYHGGNLWIRLDDLMIETEKITGQNHRYTRDEFVESLAGFADEQVIYVKGDEASKNIPSVHVENIALSTEQRTFIQEEVDQILGNPDFITQHTRQFGLIYSVLPDMDTVYPWPQNTEESILKEQRFLLDPNLTEEERRRINGQMRSSETCNMQSEELFEKLQDRAPNFWFLYGDGTFSTASNHKLLFVLPSVLPRTELANIQMELDTALVTNHNEYYPEMPSILDLTVIDPSIVQLFDENPFLADIPYAERIQFAQQLAPGSFSKDGIFVDSYITFVRFLGKIGVLDPQLYASREPNKELKWESD